MKPLIYILWIMSIGLAFAAGYHWQSLIVESTQNDKQSTRLVDTSDTSVNEQKHVTETYTNNVVSPPAYSKSRINNKPTSPDIAEKTPIYSQVYNILKTSEGHDFAAIVEAYNLLPEISEEELLENLNYLSAFEGDPNYTQTLNLFMERYASIAPLSALTFVLDNISTTQTRQNLINISLAKLSKIEPEQALDWYNNNKGEFTGRYSNSLSTIFSSLAGKDKDLAVRHLKAYMNDSDTLHMAINGLASSLSDSSEYIELLNKTSYLDNKKIQNSIVANWIRSSPSDALDWFATLPDSTIKLDTEKQIFSSYIHTDANAAADWYFANASADHKQARAIEIVNNWSFADLHQALDWVNLQADIDPQHAISKILNHAAYQNTNFAINNLELVKSDKQKADISYTIFSALQKESQQRAREFFTGSPYQKEILQRAALMKEYREKHLTND